MAHLSKNFINNIPKRLNRNVIYWDDNVKGFGLKATQAGNKNFVVQYRFHGKSRRMNIGKYGTLMPDQARLMAREILAQVILGNDPLEERQDKRREPNFAMLVEDYLTRHAIPNKSASTVLGDKCIINKFLLPSPLRHMKVSTITKRNIEPIIIKMHATPYRANRVRSLLLKMFD